MAPRNHRDSHGFTAIEIVIAVLILGIIIAPLLSSYVLGLTTTTSANATTSNSSDAQNLSAFFSSDVASAEKASIATGCGTGGGATEVLLLDLGTGATPRYISYTAEADASEAARLGVPQALVLNRVACDASNTSTQSTPVAQSMSQLPTLTCAPAACSAATSEPRTITLDVSEWGGKSSDEKYTFQISGLRRVTT